jgi:MFS family permease
LSRPLTWDRLGLILGGVLTDFLGWRWIFWVSLMYSGLITPAAFFILPNTKHTRSTPTPVNDDTLSDESHPAQSKAVLKSFKERLIRFDALGISLGLPGILLLTYSLTSSNTDGWGSPQIIATLAISIVLIIIFILHERRAASALIPAHLFQSRSFVLTLLLSINIYAVRQACTYFLTVQLQSYGNSPIPTSVLFIPPRCQRTDIQHNRRTPCANIRRTLHVHLWLDTIHPRRALVLLHH